MLFVSSKLESGLYDLIQVEEIVYTQNAVLKKLRNKINSLGIKRKYTKPSLPEYNESDIKREKRQYRLKFISGILLCSTAIIFGRVLLPILGGYLIYRAVETKRSNESIRASTLERYEQMLESYTQNIAEQNKRLPKEIAAKKELIKIYKTLEEKHNKTKDLRDSLYFHCNIYSKYRNFVAVCSFYEYITSGRCRSLEGPEGAYNKYEEEIRLNIIISQLDEVIKKLDEIEHGQQLLYSALEVCNMRINELSHDVDCLTASSNFIAEKAQIISECATWSTIELDIIRRNLS